jgi:putative spermidine/putrescine transport system permease protein
MQFPPRSVSLSQFRRFFADETWTSSLWTSVQIAVASSLIALLVGVLAAYALSRGRLRGQSIIRLGLLSPMLVPSIVLGLGAYLYLGSIGLSGTKTGIVIVHSAYVLPFVIVTTSAGLNAIDARIELAVQVLGASRTQVLRYVVIPQLRATILVGFLFAFLMSFDEVVLAWFLSGTSATTLPVKMFAAIQWEVSPIIAAVATILTLLSAVICILAAILQRDSNTKANS